jgi:hypothetical protein
MGKSEVQIEVMSDKPIELYYTSPATGEKMKYLRYNSRRWYRVAGETETEVSEYDKFWLEERFQELLARANDL